MITKKQAAILAVVAITTFGVLHIINHEPETSHATTETPLLPQDQDGESVQFFLCTSSGCEVVTAAVRHALQACARNAL